MKQSTTLRNVVALCAITLVLLLHAGVVNAQTAKAIWCAGNTTLYFTYDNVSYTVGGTYDGQPITNVWRGADVTNTPSDPMKSPSWVNVVRNKATGVVFDASFDVLHPTSLQAWFYNFVRLKSITGIEYLHTDQATSMSGMFYYCEKLTSLDVSGFKTSNVTNMANMFFMCKAKVLDVSGFDTSNVTDMQSMFAYCSSVSNLDVSHFNTENVTNMGSMFAGCSSLSSLDVSHFNTENVTGMGSMFSGCKNLPSLDVSGFETSEVTTMYSMFDECSSLPSLDVSKFNTSKVTNMAYMFNKCSSLPSLDVSNFNTGNVTDMQYMFSGCSSLPSLDVSGFNTSNVTNMQYMFSGCSSLPSLDVTNFDTSKVTNMSNMFSGCSSLPSLDVSKFNTSKVTNMAGIFQMCSSLPSLDVSNFDTSNVTLINHMFYGCRSLTSIDVSNFNTSKVTEMQSMFYGCRSLTSLDVSHFDTSKVTKIGAMFYGCSSLPSLDVSNFNTSNVTDMGSMFQDCSSLTSLDVTNFNTEKVTDMRYMFYKCKNLKGITFGENFNMNKVSRSSEMFRDCEKLRYIDFYNCNYATSGSGMSFPLNSVSLYGSTFTGVPTTTVIYLPKGNGVVTNVRNVVYSNDGDEDDLRCPNYYSEDKVDIELPHAFKTKKAEYKRTMSTQYGSVILPYDFTTNSKIQAYTLDEEHTETMYFKDAATVPAHTPFAFKKLGNADFTMTDATGGFGITVNATHTTSAAEGGEPYTHSENLGGWTTKGYYVNEKVADFDGTFYIARDKFFKATAALTLYPHRVTFHGAWKINPATSNGAKAINFVDGETNAIDAAEARMAEQNEIYDAQGRQHSKLTRGLNIIRMSDGTTRKVIRK